MSGSSDVQGISSGGTPNNGQGPSHLDDVEMTGSPSDVGKVVCAIDCGSQSTRVLIRDAQQVYLRGLVATRISDGLADTGRISALGEQRFLAALEHFVAQCRRFEVTEIVAVATAAARRASNSGPVLAAASDIIGTEIELIDGETEARLSFDGAANSLNTVGDFLVFDIGGASTELAYGYRRSLEECAELKFSGSLGLGSVTTSQTYLFGDPPSKDSIERCLAKVSESVKKFADQHTFADMGSVHVIGCAGTVATTVAIVQELDTYVREKIHHFELTYQHVQQCLSRLTSLDVQARSEVVGLESSRVESIIGGVAILKALMETLNIDSITASEDDMLDALAESRLKL